MWRQHGHNIDRRGHRDDGWLTRSRTYLFTSTGYLYLANHHDKRNGDGAALGTRQQSNRS
jgi:hypothetical protein